MVVQVSGRPLSGKQPHTHFTQSCLELWSNIIWTQIFFLYPFVGRASGIAFYTPNRDKVKMTKSGWWLVAFKKRGACFTTCWLGLYLIHSLFETLFQRFFDRQLEERVYHWDSPRCTSTRDVGCLEFLVKSPRWGEPGNWWFATVFTGF